MTTEEITQIEHEIQPALMVRAKDIDIVQVLKTARPILVYISTRWFLGRKVKDVIVKIIAILDRLVPLQTV